MARILIAWELGGGLGHVVPLTEVAQHLAALGHEPVFALRTPAAALKHWGARRFPLLATPFPPGTVRVANDAAGFAGFVDVLWNECGFHDAQRLAAAWTAWRGLVETVAPDLVVADSAPLAIAAARGLGIPSVACGVPFAHPSGTPWPPFRTWGGADASHLPARTAQALAHANAAAATHGQAPFADIADVVRADATLLATLPEIDLYAPRADADYVGPIVPRGGATPRWPAGEGPRVFAYLKREHPYSERLLGAIARLTDARVALHYDGDASRLPAHVALQPGLVDVAQVFEGCAAFVSAGGTNLVGCALLAGVPQLVMPMHAEQMATGLCVARSGAGLVVAPPLDRPDFLGPLRQLLAEPGFREAAVAIAARHALVPADAAERVAGRLGAMLRQNPRVPAASG